MPPGRPLPNINEDVTVARVDPVAEEVVDEALCHAAGSHVCLHVDFLDEETGVFQHGLHTDDIGVDGAPRQRLHGHIDVVAAGLAHFEHRGHREARRGVTVVLHLDFGVLCLNVVHNLAQADGATHASHIFERDFLRAGGDEFVGHLHIVFGGVHLRIGDAHGGLRNHACYVGPLDGRDDVAHVVEAAEDTGDVNALGFLHLIHQLAHVGGHGVHPQSVEGAVEHVALDAALMQCRRESAD